MGNSSSSGKSRKGRKKKGQKNRGGNDECEVGSPFGRHNNHTLRRIQSEGDIKVGPFAQPAGLPMGFMPSMLPTSYPQMRCPCCSCIVGGQLPMPPPPPPPQLMQQRCCCCCSQAMPQPPIPAPLQPPPMRQCCCCCCGSGNDQPQHQQQQQPHDMEDDVRYSKNNHSCSLFRRKRPQYKDSFESCCSNDYQSYTPRHSHSDPGVRSREYCNECSPNAYQTNRACACVIL